MFPHTLMQARWFWKNTNRWPFVFLRVLLQETQNGSCPTLGGITFFSLVEKSTRWVPRSVLWFWLSSNFLLHTTILFKLSRGQCPYWFLILQSHSFEDLKKQTKKQNLFCLQTCMPIIPPLVSFQGFPLYIISQIYSFISIMKSSS